MSGNNLYRPEPVDVVPAFKTKLNLVGYRVRHILIRNDPYIETKRELFVS